METKTPKLFEAGGTTKAGDAEILEEIIEYLVECAVLAYEEPDHIKSELNKENDPDGFVWFEAVGNIFDTQAFAVVFPKDIVLAFRGTKELRDFLTDLMVVRTDLKSFDDKEPIFVDATRLEKYNILPLRKKSTVTKKTVGKRKMLAARVHLGFNRALNGIWSEDTNAYKVAEKKGKEPDTTIVEFLEKNHTKKRLWLCGHSLGGALATVAAAKIALSKETPTNKIPFKNKIEGLVTIGSPRVFKKMTSKALNAALEPSFPDSDLSPSSKIYRIYRSMDPVSAIPYRPYHHVTGRKRAFVNHKGNLVVGQDNLSSWMDTWGSILGGIENSIGSMIPGQHRGLATFVQDHSSADYLDAVKDRDDNGSKSLGRLSARIFIPIFKILAPGAIATGGLIAILMTLNGSPDPASQTLNTCVGVTLTFAGCV